MGICPCDYWNYHLYIPGLGGTDTGTTEKNNPGGHHRHLRDDHLLSYRGGIDHDGASEAV